MTRLPTPGSDAGAWGQILNDYLSQAHKPDGSLKDNVVGADNIASGSITEDNLSSDVVTKLNATQEDVQEALDDKLDRTEGITYVNHGSNASTARPLAPLVYWNGSVFPSNAVTGDLCRINTTYDLYMLDYSGDAYLWRMISLPKPGDEGQVLRSDGAKWISGDISYVAETPLKGVPDSGIGLQALDGNADGRIFPLRWLWDPDSNTGQFVPGPRLPEPETAAGRVLGADEAQNRFVWVDPPAGGGWALSYDWGGDLATITLAAEGAPVTVPCDSSSNIWVGPGGIHLNVNFPLWPESKVIEVEANYLSITITLNNAAELGGEVISAIANMNVTPPPGYPDTRPPQSVVVELTDGMSSRGYPAALTLLPYQNDKLVGVVYGVQNGTYNNVRIVG